MHKKKSLIAKLIKAFDEMKERKDELPEEFQFLLDDDIKQKLLEAQSNEEKIFAAADLLGETIGDENVDESKMEELIQYLKQEGIIESEEGEEEAEDEENKEDEVAQGDKGKGKGEQEGEFPQGPAQEGGTKEDVKEEAAGAVQEETPEGQPEQAAQIPPGDLGEPPQEGSEAPMREDGKEPETGVSLAPGTIEDASQVSSQGTAEDSKEKVIRRAVKAFESLLREE